MKASHKKTARTTHPASDRASGRTHPADERLLAEIEGRALSADSLRDNFAHVMDLLGLLEMAISDQVEEPHNSSLRAGICCIVETIDHIHDAVLVKKPTAEVAS